MIENREIKNKKKKTKNKENKKNLLQRKILKNWTVQD